MKTVLLARITMPHHIFQFFILELIPPTIGHLHGAMWSIVGNIGKEGFFSFNCSIDEIHRFSCEVVDTEPLSFHQFPISFH